MKADDFLMPRPWYASKAASLPPLPATALGKRKAMTSSERGIKFRQKQRERSAQLETSTAALRAELLRLQALRDVWRSSSFSRGSVGTPVQFALEFFAQFRDGVFHACDPRRLQQEEFLAAMVEPTALHTDGRPLARAILSDLQSESKLFPTLHVEREATEMLTADGCAVVISRGCKRLRYSRRALEARFPRALANEQLVRKLVGRQLRVPFRTTMIFSENGRVSAVETDEQAAGALYDVLRDLKECVAVLGPASKEDAWRHHHRHLQRH